MEGTDLDKILAGQFCKMHKTILDELGRCELCLQSAPIWHPQLTMRDCARQTARKASLHGRTTLNWIWAMLIVIGILLIGVAWYSNEKGASDYNRRMERRPELQRDVPSIEPWTSPKFRQER